MEAELLRTKHDMMCLNNQLLEAIQRKLELSQELEAWQVRHLCLISQSSLSRLGCVLSVNDVLDPLSPPAVHSGSLQLFNVL